MFITATNNVIWRLATGKRSRQDDPELIDLTQRILNNFKTMDPSSPLALLAMNSVYFTKFLSLLGLPNFLDSTKKISDVINDQVGRVFFHNNILNSCTHLQESESLLLPGVQR